MKLVIMVLITSFLYRKLIAIWELPNPFTRGFQALILSEVAHHQIISHYDFVMRSISMEHIVLHQFKSILQNVRLHLFHYKKVLIGRIIFFYEVTFK